MITYIIITITYVLIAIIFAAVITGKSSNYVLTGKFGKYVLISLLLSPMFAMIFAVLDAVTIGNKVEQKTVKENPKQAKLEDGQIWIANDDDKRITIYESELDDYIKNGWHKL